MKILKYLLLSLALIVSLFLIFLIISTISDYRPDETEIVFEAEEAYEIDDSTFTAVSWNIGYAGLDASMDFFYDGGEKVRPEKDAVKRNLTGILQTLEEFQGIDFILLQEVDKRSKRSYKHEIDEYISNLFSSYHSSFGLNYDVNFVPIPVKSPMGRVESGLQSLSAEIPEKATRFSFPGNYSWPMGIFMLDRCFLESRFPLPGGKELVIINTHNSAYDDGSLRQQQMEFMKEILIREYEEGNYVVAGGDWNQTPYDFIPAFDGDIFDEEDLTYIDADYPATEWTWAYDASTPTNRRVKTPYIKGETSTTLIDCFLLSPNVQMLEVKGITLGFAYSDHQPVTLTFKIK
jgi:endonuclease/exonuclease/phosphatase family metal-dependent hydrolase